MTAERFRLSVTNTDAATRRAYRTFRQMGLSQHDASLVIWGYVRGCEDLIVSLMETRQASATVAPDRRGGAR